LDGGYEGTTSKYSKYLLAILNIFKSQNCKLLSNTSALYGTSEKLILVSQLDA
jgi:hypothetical protein